MKNRKSIVWTFAVAILMGSLASATSFAGDKQQVTGAGGGPAVKAIDLISQAADKVNLTDEQKPKVKEIVDDAVAQAKALHDDAKATRGQGGDKKADKKDAKQTGQELVMQTKQRVEAVLTDTQKADFRKALAALRAEAKHDRGQNKGGTGDTGATGGTPAK